MSTSSPFAVSMMIGTWLRVRSRRQTSIPSSFGQHHVEHHQVKALLGEAVQGLLPVDRPDHLVPFLAEGVGEKRLHGLLVVHEQYPRLSWRHSGRLVR